MAKPPEPMKRWDGRVCKEVQNDLVDKFLLEIIEVCKKHNMSIGHEDEHGGFLIDNYDEGYTAWLEAAAIKRGSKL